MILHSSKKLKVLITFLLRRVVLFMQQRESTELNGTIYLTPFKWQLWIAMMAAMLLLAVSLSICFYMAYRYSKTEQQHYSFSQSLFSALEFFCAQGNNWNIKRIFLFSSLHESLFVLCRYTCTWMWLFIYLVHYSLRQVSLEFDVCLSVHICICVDKKTN